MKSLAFVVGNADYPGIYQLNNSVNDATAIAHKLETLDYQVIRSFNSTKDDFYRILADFSRKLKTEDYEIGLFYFSGHGVQCDGVNYLTAIDTSFHDLSSIKHSSVPLDAIIDALQHAHIRIKILILDACRDNPFPSSYRSGAITSGLAPVHAPKGTIIAFSTSPGERAKDTGLGNNSIYTGTLLRHIDDRNIPIEDVFKRVRTSVYTHTEGSQTSWEHTSLIGDYYFNYGQRTSSPTLPYRPDVVADSDYIVNPDSIFGSIIEDLKISHWDYQKSAIRQINKTNLNDADDSDLFLLGRNILQAAQGSSYEAIDKISNFSSWRNGLSPEQNIHILNGILYEIYFNSRGKFRGETKLKSSMLQDVLELQKNSKYKKSFDFINNQLQPFSKDLFYIPGKPDSTLAIEIKTEKIREKEDDFSDQEIDIYIIKSIKYQGVEILHEDFTYENMPMRKPYSKFKDELTNRLHIPKNQLTVILDVNEDHVDTIEINPYYKISRNPIPVDSF